MDCDGGRSLGWGSWNCEEPDETKHGDGEGEREWQHVPQNCAYSLGDPGRDVRHCSLGPPESTTQTASRRFIRFCMAHGCIQQTHRPHYTNSNRSHSMPCIAMRPRNVKKYRKIVMGFCDINNSNKKQEKQE